MLIWNSTMRYLRRAGVESTALFKWWWEELRVLAALGTARFKSDRNSRVVVLIADDAAVLKTLDSSHPALDIAVPMFERELPATIDGLWPTDREQPGTAQLAFSESQVLLRRLDFPAVSDSDLTKIVALRIEREAPLVRERLYVDWIVVGRTPQKVSVLMGMIRRSEVARAIASIEKWKWKVASVGVWQDTGAMLFDFSQPRAVQHQVQHQWRRPLIASAATLGLATAIAIAGQWVYERQRVNPQLNVAKAQLSAHAEKVDQLRRQGEPLVELRKFMAAPSVAEILTALTSILPADTWVSDLDVQVSAGEAGLRIVGYAPSATSLVELIEKSDQFGDVQLISATQVGVGAGDRVELVAKWVIKEPATAKGTAVARLQSQARL